MATSGTGQGDGDVWSIEPDHLDRARATVAEHALRTSLVHAPELGARVWLKLETEQRTGSFKVRGALARLSALTDAERAAGVVAASAGNHGLGVAYAARVLGTTARVHLPRSTPAVKRDGIASLGAEIVVEDTDGYDATEQRARTAAEAEGAVFVSPFDDPWVAAGNGGTIGLEVFEDLDELTTIVAPVGGGGLMAGLAAARDATERDVRLAGVQSEACPAMVRSIEHQKPLEQFAGEPTLAEGLEGGVSAASFYHVRRAVARMEALPEAAIADAMHFARRQLGLRVEGSAAVALAWARDRAVTEPGEGAIVIVVTGGNVDAVGGEERGEGPSGQSC